MLLRISFAHANSETPGAQQGPRRSKSLYPPCDALKAGFNVRRHQRRSISPICTLRKEAPPSSDLESRVLPQPIRYLAEVMMSGPGYRSLKKLGPFQGRISGGGARSGAQLLDRHRLAQNAKQLKEAIMRKDRE
jgi:hypothetical protein